jgi:hypothetical protein
MAHPIQFVDYTEDPSPVEQQGVRAAYPQGYNGMAFGWAGRLSDLVAQSGTAKFKLAEGFLPRRYAVYAKPLAGNVYIDSKVVGGDALFLKEGASAKISTAAAVKGVTFSNVTIAGPVDGSDSDSDADEDTATIGLVGQGALTGEIVTDDETWVTLTASATASGDVERGVSDCYVEVLVYAEQVDPYPPKMF